MKTNRYREGDIIPAGGLEWAIPAYLEAVDIGGGYVHIRERKETRKDGYFISVTFQDGRVFMLDEPVAVSPAQLDQIDVEWKEREKDLGTVLADDQLEIARFKDLLQKIGGVVSDGMGGL